MTPETKRIIIAAASGFVIGKTLEQYKNVKRRRAVVEKFNSQRSSDFWQTVQKYLENPRDDRSVEQMVKDWQTNLEFHKIVRDNNL